MSEHTDSRTEQNQISVKQVAGALVFLLISSLVYIFISTVKAQNDATAAVGKDVDTLRTQVVPELQRSNSLLTQLFQQQNERLNRLETKIK